MKDIFNRVAVPRRWFVIVCAVVVIVGGVANIWWYNHLQATIKTETPVITPEIMAIANECGYWISTGDEKVCSCDGQTYQSQPHFGGTNVYCVGQCHSCRCLLKPDSKGNQKEVPCSDS